MLSGVQVISFFERTGSYLSLLFPNAFLGQGTVPCPNIGVHILGLGDLDGTAHMGFRA